MTSGQPPIDRQWIRATVARFERPLVAYAAHILGDVERARDVVQDTFIKLCSQNQQELEPHLNEWLFTVCRNRAVDVRRKEKRMSLLGESESAVVRSGAPGPDDLAEQKDSARGIMAMLDQLPENQREVIRLKFQHGMSYKQISAITSLSVTNVGFLIHTGLKAVRQHLAEASERRSV